MISTRFTGTSRSLTFILVGIVVLMSILSPRRFLTVGNVISMGYQLPIIAFLSIGMMVTMLSGGINLAIVATANFTGIITALLLKALAGAATAEAGVGVVLVAMGGGLAAALIVGAAMGWLIAYVKVPDILATLGAMTLLNGVNVVITKGYTLSDFPPFLLAIGNGTVARVPIALFVLLGVCLWLAVILNRSVFGMSLFLIGSNPIAAKFSNIKVRSVVVREYILSAFFSALTAFIMLGQFNSVNPDYAQSYLLVSVLACFLGGIDPFGGAGRLSGMILAVVILQVVSTGVGLLRMNTYLIQAMWGFIIIVLIGVNHFTAKLRERSRLRETARLQTRAGQRPPVQS